MRFTLVAAALISAAQALPTATSSETTLAKGSQDATLHHRTLSNVNGIYPRSMDDKEYHARLALNNQQLVTLRRGIAKTLPPPLEKKFMEQAKFDIDDGHYVLVDRWGTRIPLENAGTWLRNLHAQILQQNKVSQAATAPNLGVPQAAGPRWKEPNSSKCRNNESVTEDCLGTKRFCAVGASSVKEEAKREKARKDCEASRGGRPSGATTTDGSSTAVYLAKESKQAKPDIDAYDRIPI
ncbi:hypothetical protein BDV24DRAFT_170464 [Aspergillus arachidicola]|uniref:Uncharacterized protein n=1 Tax=Aspergillus arachidicola TaxID=656916 RepID=A0A5N6XLN8_9EURO|nr:hypothetical protein BDV24DRAFT_170464 [Aspergillus arachidicola]